MNKISKKTYYCPMCSTKKRLETNNDNDIYLDCEKCGCSMMYCASRLAKKRKESFPYILAKINFYKYNSLNPKEKSAYRSLVKELSSEKTITDISYEKHFEQIVPSVLSVFKVYIKCLKKKDVVKIYLEKKSSKSKSDDKLYSDAGVLFNWWETNFSTKSTKVVGYYLTRVTEDVVDDEDAEDNEEYKEYGDGTYPYYKHGRLVDEEDDAFEEMGYTR